MPKSIDSIGRKPEKKKVEPIAVHKAGEVFRPRGENPHAGEQIKPKDYVDPKSQEKKTKVLTPEEHEASQRHANAPRKKSVRKALILTGVIVVLILISIPVVNYVQTYLKKQNEKKYVNAVCTTQHADVLEDAITAVNLQNVSQLDPLIAKIKLYEHYELDQNCLAPIVWRAILKGDVSAARSGVNSITEIYNSNVEKGAEGAVYTSNPQKLNDRIVVLQKQIDEQSLNMQKFNERQQP